MYHPGLSAAAKAFACAPLAFSRFYWFASSWVNQFLEFANAKVYQKFTRLFDD
jgi:hypothetical protein